MHYYICIPSHISSITVLTTFCTAAKKIVSGTTIPWFERCFGHFDTVTYILKHLFSEIITNEINFDRHFPYWVVVNDFLLIIGNDFVKLLVFPSKEMPSYGANIANIWTYHGMICIVFISLFLARLSQWKFFVSSNHKRSSRFVEFSMNRLIIGLLISWAKHLVNLFSKVPPTSRGCDTIFLPSKMLIIPCTIVTNDFIYFVSGKSL